MKWLPEKRIDLGVVWKVFPLAVHAGLFSLIMTAYSAVTLALFLCNHTALKTDGSAIIMYVFNGLQIAFGVVTIGSILARWLPGVKLYQNSLGYLLFSWLCYLVVIIILYCAKGGKKLNMQAEWIDIIIAGVVAVILLLYYFSLRHSVASLIKVLDVGGHGFEKLNYMEIKTGVEGTLRDEYSTSSDPEDEP